jgi:hypothetical protein
MMDTTRLLEAFETKQAAENGLHFWAGLVSDMKMSHTYGVKVARIPGTHGWYGVFAEGHTEGGQQQ